MAVSLCRLGRGTSEALAYFDRALAVEPAYHHALAQKGYALFRLGEVAAALDLYRRALTVRPGHPDTLRALAITLLRLGRHREALEAFQRLGGLGELAKGDTLFFMALCRFRLWLARLRERLGGGGG